MKRILRRHEHEKVHATRKVRSFKHRRSRATSCRSLTWDKKGRHWRRHEAWKREKRRHRGNKPDPRKTFAAVVSAYPEAMAWVRKQKPAATRNVWQQCDNSNLALADLSKLEQRFAAVHPESALAHDDFYDDHSPFKSIQRRM